MSKPQLGDDLHFPQGEVQGFSTLATSKWAGNPEPVVRELLQNCLDAANKAGRPTAEVCFSMGEEPLADIPGIDSYRRHFEQAVDERSQGTQSASEKQVIAKIRRVLNESGGGGGKTTRVLFCRDNGIGLNSDSIERVLTEGNTEKEAGAGAFGVGHLTAFAASDLRYVLYAGRARDSGGSETTDVASGHAILASYKRDKRGGHGYWLRGKDPNSVPDLFDPLYPDRAPRLLARELDHLDDTGTVVCIAGFNDFTADGADPATAIARVAAKNFLLAIWQGRMAVTIRHRDVQTVVDRTTLGAILERDRERKRGEQKGGWFPGAQAYQAWEVLKKGEQFRLESGADVHILLPDYHGERKSLSRVQVFRKGMWITNDADELEPRRFKTTKPFAALIAVESGEIERLVRSAEGPEHRGLNRGRLGSEDSRSLLVALRGIAEELRAKAGKEEESSEYTPDDFAMVAPGRRGAERVGKYRPRAGAGRRRATSMEKASNGESTDPRHRKNRKRVRKTGAAPRPGRSVSGRLSWLATPDQDGRLREIRVAWRPRVGRSGKHSLGVRVRVPSGSDETCEAPLAPTWLRVDGIRLADRTIHAGDDDLEIELPADCREFTVILAKPAKDPNAMEIDLVRRRTELPPDRSGASAGVHQR